MWIALAANIGPLFVHLTDDANVSGIDLFRGDLLWAEFFKTLVTVFLLILSTRAVSRTPALLKAISTIFSFTPGLHAS